MNTIARLAYRSSSTIIRNNTRALQAFKPVAVSARYYSAETKEGEAKAEESKEVDATAELKKQLAEKEEKLAKIQDGYLRALADMENLRQRTQKEKEQASQFAIQKFVKDLVDTVDILGLALKATPEAKCNDKENHKELADLYSGVSMTQTELLKTLKRHGVEQINPIDQEFDPNQHQALYQAPIPGKEANFVFAVEKIGYTLNGRVIRPAQVGVVQSTN